jgi:hypothetical protein
VQIPDQRHVDLAALTQLVEKRAAILLGLARQGKMSCPTWCDPTGKPTPALLWLSDFVEQEARLWVLNHSAFGQDIRDKALERPRRSSDQGPGDAWP